jgi:predicted PurR-regulated permease PerM
MLIVVADAVRVIWLPMALAFGLVFLLSPLVKWLEGRGMPRLIGSFLAFGLLVGAIVTVALLVFPTVRDQVVELVQRLPDLYVGVLDWARDLGERLGVDVDGILSLEGLEQWLEDPANQETIQNLLLGFGASAGFLIRGVTEAFVILGLAPVLAIYILIDLERFKENAVKLTPPRNQEEVAYVGGEVGVAMGSFVRGQLLVAFLVGLASSIGMWFIDLPFWLLVGMIAGLLNLIPFLGPIVGGALAFVVALLNGDPWQGVWAVVIFTVIQQIDNHIITPMIQRTRVNLSPFSIVVALVIGGSLAGLLGVLVAVPMTAAIRIISGHLWRTRVLGQSWSEASEAMIEVTEPPERLARLARRPSQQPRLFDTQELPPVEVEPSETASEEPEAGNAAYSPTESSSPR